MAGLGFGQRRSCRRDLLGTDAAATTDDLRPFLAPAQRELGVLLGADAGLLTPAGGRKIAEVGVHAERQIGEVAQPGEHADDVIWRQAVERERADPHLLEPPRGPPERIALGSAPVLSVHAAHAVAAAAKAQPHGQAGVEKSLDGRVRGAANQRQRLHQDQVGRVLLERPREQADRLAPVGGVDVTVDAERHRDLVGATAFGRGFASEADAAPRQVHPVDRLARLPESCLAVAQRGGETPRVGADHVAPDLDVAAMDRLDVAGVLEDRGQTPQMLLELGSLAADADQLGAGGAVHDHRVIGGDQAGQAGVAALALLAVGQGLRVRGRHRASGAVCRGHVRAHYWISLPCRLVRLANRHSLPTGRPLRHSRSAGLP